MMKKVRARVEDVDQVDRMKREVSGEVMAVELIQAHGVVIRHHRHHQELRYHW